ncbi:hypothetical protein [Bosea minatitlanensis]|uniref:AsmA-like C-terminal domain-containing protein n=1 Tax=Bosea minatitlanensis TaxID=128782 RepID=A0ABW0F059_9HYPH|nr:hypothetical protein [Bosea minatitlanensis]MCT4492238.1 hypothetical protein [Bosea minatitlanensis]
MTAARLRRPTQRGSTALAAVFIALAAPAWAADFQVDDVRLDLGRLVISIPKVSVKGSNLEKEAFLALFAKGANESVPARIAKLTAAEISAPELTMEQSVGEQKQTTTYRDIRLTDIGDGKIGHGESASGSLAIQGGTAGSMKGTLKRTAFDALDLKQSARVLTEKAAPGVDEAYVPVIGRFEQDGYDLDMGKAGSMSIGRTTARGFAMKVGPEPLLDLVEKIGKNSEALEKKADHKAAADDDGNDKSDVEKQFALSMLTLFDMVDYGSGEARDFKATIRPPASADAENKDKGKDKARDPVDWTIDRIAFGENAPDKSGFAVEGMAFTSGPGKGRIDSISYSGFSFANVVRELRTLLAKPDSEIEALDYRRLIPKIGTMRFAGFSIDLPASTTGTEPVKVALGTFELKAGEPLNGIPTSLGLTIDKLVTPVIASDDNPALKDMLAMGIDKLDLSARLDLAWEAAKNELAIRSFSFGSAGLAQLDAKGTLGNVTQDLFSSDLALAQVAALGATARNLQVKLQNFGLVEKLIENQARKTKRKVEEVRQQFAMVASVGLAAMLGPSDAAKTLSSAASRFVAKPGTLTVDAAAKSPAGLGLADVLTISQPTEIFDKIDVKADAR